MGYVRKLIRRWPLRVPKVRQQHVGQDAELLHVAGIGEPENQALKVETLGCCFDDSSEARIGTLSSIVQFSFLLENTLYERRSRS